MQRNRFFLPLGAFLFFTILRPSVCQDLATPEIFSAMQREWTYYRQDCLRALELFGASKANTEAALKEVERHQNSHVRELYDFAGHKDASAFFHSLATAHQPDYSQDCVAADLVLTDEYHDNVVALQRASLVYQEKGELAAFHILLAGLGNGPLSFQQTEHLIACYASANKHLFYKVDELLGVH